MVMTEKVKWGVIGSGGIARRRSIPEGIVRSEHSKLVAVYDTDQKVNRSVAGEFAAVPAESISQLMDSGIDSVYIASPADMHPEHTLTCARAKKHILCEKPLGITVAEAEEMINTCREEGVILGVGLMMRFSAQHRAALELIRQGRLGKPVYARAQLSCWYPPLKGAWRQDPARGGGGSLMDMGSHCLDLLEMFFGRIRNVSCYINNNVHDYSPEDSAVVSCMFENGALGTVDTYFCIPDNSSRNVLELYGSRGSILATGTIGQGAEGEMKAFLEGDESGYNSRQERRTGEGIIINPEPVNTYMAEFEEFSSAILEKRKPLNSFAPGLRNLKVLEACYRSARTGQIINVE